MLFDSMVEIIDVISEQIFDKMTTIPYAIRQFCKCLYQSLKDKFVGPKSAQDFDYRVMRVVSSFLLEKWMLNSIFVNLNMEGLIKDFIMPKNCTLNLQLMFQILNKTMTWQDWEMPTPASEKIPGDKGPDLFTMPQDLKSMIRQKSRIFFKDLLFLDKDFNSSNGAK